FTAFEACGRLYQFRRIPFGVTNGVSCFQRTIDEIISSEKLKNTFAYVDNITVCGMNEVDHEANLQSFLDIAKKYKLTFNKAKCVTATTEIKLLGYQISHGSLKPDPDRLKPLQELPPPADSKVQQRIVGFFAYYSPWISNFSNKIYPLIHNKTFPLPSSVMTSFNELKKELASASLSPILPDVPLVVETDASDVAIAATLNQDSRPVAFFSRMLNPSEKHHSAVEKEAYAVIEAIRKWRHLLLYGHFKLVTDQQSISFIYGNQHRGRVKNDKILRWKMELAPYSFDVVYRPGKLNQAADALSRSCCGALLTGSDLARLHVSLCHPGVSRMTHFVRNRNLPFSVEEIKRMTANCQVCNELKPKFQTAFKGHLIKATQPFERLSMDFKGPLPSSTRNNYLLTIVDEYSRFPFAFACADI
ncbi:MAG: RNase H-like domain-containing protein, partial [Lactococcus garvieae]